LQDFFAVDWNTVSDGTHLPRSQESDDRSNLAAPATAATSLGSETDAIDPETGQLAPLFNPQTQHEVTNLLGQWRNHNWSKAYRSGTIIAHGSTTKCG